MITTEKIKDALQRAVFIDKEINSLETQLSDLLKFKNECIEGGGYNSSKIKIEIKETDFNKVSVEYTNDNWTTAQKIMEQIDVILNDLLSQYKENRENLVIENGEEEDCSKNFGWIWCSQCSGYSPALIQLSASTTEYARMADITFKCTEDEHNYMQNISVIQFGKGENKYKFSNGYEIPENIRLEEFSDGIFTNPYEESEFFYMPQYMFDSTDFIIEGIIKNHIKSREENLILNNIKWEIKIEPIEQPNPIEEVIE